MLASFTSLVLVCLLKETHFLYFFSFLAVGLDETRWRATGERWPLECLLLFFCKLNAVDCYATRNLRWLPCSALWLKGCFAFAYEWNSLFFGINHCLISPFRRAHRWTKVFAPQTGWFYIFNQLALKSVVARKDGDSLQCQIQRMCYYTVCNSCSLLWRMWLHHLWSLLWDKIKQIGLKMLQIIWKDEAKSI